MTSKPLETKTANVIAFGFSLVILIYAAPGPLTDLVR